MRLTLVSTFLILMLVGLPVAQARCFGVPTGDQESFVPWYVHLDISASDGLADEVEFGVAPGLSDGFEQGVDEYKRLDQERPLQAFFLYPDAGGPFSRLSRSFTSFADGISWLLIIVYSGEPTEILVRWDTKQTGSIPSDIGLRLVTFFDEDVDMKTVEDVVFQAEADTYGFRIISSRLEEINFDLALVLVAYGIVAVALILILRRRR